MFHNHNNRSENKGWMVFASGPPSSLIPSPKLNCNQREERKVGEKSGVADESNSFSDERESLTDQQRVAASVFRGMRGAPLPSLGSLFSIPRSVKDSRSTLDGKGADRD